MFYDTTNVFARILREELPCKKIIEDSHFLAFYTIAPLAPVHALVIPKGPFKDAYDFNTNAAEEALIGFYKGVSKVTEILGLNKTGFRQISNC